MSDEKNLQKMLELVRKVERYCDGMGYEDFADDEMLVEACVFNLAQLGEASHKVSDEYVQLHPELVWNELYGLRNRLVHDYQGVNLNLVWEIITEDLPKLEAQLEGLL